MKTYLTSLSLPFSLFPFIFFYTYMSLIFFWYQPFLIFFWHHFHLTRWTALGKAVYSLDQRNVYLLRDFLAKWCLIFPFFSDSTLPLPCITWVSWLIRIQLVARGCLPVHTPILGKLDRQSHPWLNFSSTSADLRGKQKEGEGDRDRERERGVILYLWAKYEFDYPQWPNS